MKQIRLFQCKDNNLKKFECKVNNYLKKLDDINAYDINLHYGANELITEIAVEYEIFDTKHDVLNARKLLRTPQLN